MDCCIAKCKMDGIVTQPMILMKAENEELDKSPEFFIICDSQALPVNGNASKALELLFKVFYCFNVAYPSELAYTYDFLEAVFGMSASGSSEPARKKARSVYMISTNLARKFLKMLS